MAICYHVILAVLTIATVVVILAITPTVVIFTVAATVIVLAIVALWLSWSLLVVTSKSLWPSLLCQLLTWTALPVQCVTR